MITLQCISRYSAQPIALNLTHLDDATCQEQGLVVALGRVLVELVGAEIDGVPIRIVIVVHLAAQLNVLCKAHPIGVLANDVTGMDLGIVIPLIDVNLDRVGLALLTGVVGLSACGRVVATLLEPVV